jgi:SAM-dependent methyltransferase
VRAANQELCDLCGADDREFILSTPRLEGPLVRCRDCSLYFVETNGDLSAVPTAASQMERLSERALELDLVDPSVEERERPWRELAARERVEELLSFVASGKLLEVGCSTGEFLSASGDHFKSTGIEADEGSSGVARSRGLDCLTCSLTESNLEAEEFDVVALYHTIEHLPSPKRAVGEAHRLLRRGGWLVIETPDIGSPWFRILGARWRQFIPDHRYFFTQETIRRLCIDAGFDVRSMRQVGKAMSTRLFASRVGRYNKRLGSALSVLGTKLGVEEKTLRLNLGDVMRLYAQKKGSGVRGQGSGVRG